MQELDAADRRLRESRAAGDPPRCRALAMVEVARCLAEAVASVNAAEEAGRHPGELVIRQGAPAR
jgi:hypothetical protein